MSEHVLLVGREEGLARRYRQHSAGVTVTVMCRTEHVSRVSPTGDCARVLALPAQAETEALVCIAGGLHAGPRGCRIAL